MEYGNLDKMREAFKNRQDPDNCKHDWDYMVQGMAKGNIFIELCRNCFDTRGTIERFVK
jgi:sulfur relay (sulfurtransferase) complex TusBCD TusD component (DsrE family)